jgi:hypothetical protein
MSVVVTAIIPTIGRESLRQAIRSAVAQGPLVGEVLVVGSGVSDELVQSFSSESKVRFLRSDERLRGAHSRQLGTEQARGSLIAYLDDDDFWLPNKTASQVACLSQTMSSRICMTRARVVGDNGSQVWPRTLPESEEDPATYLFGYGSILPGSRYAGSSTWMLPKTLALEVGWDSSFLIHEDWGFILRARRREMKFCGLDIVGAQINQTGSGRTSKSGRWQESLTFVSSSLSVQALSATEAGNIVCNVSLQLALDSGSLKGVLSCVRFISSHRPSPANAVQMLARLGGIRHLVRAMLRFWLLLRKTVSGS